MPGVPMSLKGVRREALETAREAARRAGMSVDDWLNSVIADKAAETGVQPKQRDAGEASERQIPLSPTADAAPKEAPRQDRRDDQRKERIEPARDRAAKPSTAGTSRSPGLGALHESPALPATDALSRLDARLNQISAGRRASGEIERRVSGVDWTPPSLGRERPQAATPKTISPLERAVAEITARQRELDGDPAPRAQALLPELPLFAGNAAPNRPDLSGLQDQIEHLTSRIETMRRPCGVEDSVKALRGDLADIARTLTDAMPRKAVEALENEVRGLAQRLAESRRSGADLTALAGVERGLAEVRIALCTLTPAEGLVAFQQAVKALSEKIDQIPATNRDPSALRQFETSINSLRGVVASVASNEALAKVAESVRELSAKVDRIAGSSGGGGDVLVSLEKRIGLLADTLQARAPAEKTDLSQLETMVGRLTEKIERLQEQRNDPTARGPLEERIIKLMEKVDASDARLGQLEVIERTLVDVLRHLEELRATNAAARQGAEAQAQAVVPVVDGLKRDLDTLRMSDRRTQDSLEAVHGALGDVVGRIATLETDLRSAAAAAPGPQAAARRQSAPTPAAKPLPGSGERRPIDPNLPPHHPLEPGVGRGRGNAAERIAASEAVLANTMPASPEPEPRSNFIAAARRAAQSAAASLRDPNAGEPTRSDAKSADAVPIGQRLAKHVKSLLVGSSIVLLMIGSWHLAAALFDPADPALSDPGRPEPVKSGQALPRSGDQSSSGSAAARQTLPDRTPRFMPDGDIPGAKTASPDMTGAAAARPETQPPSGASPATTATVASSSALFTPGALSAAPQPKLGAPQFQLTPAAAETPSGPSLASGADKLPAAIGGQALRKAAAAGDPAAEYEVASRYADGRNVTANIAEAARWYERAAAHGLVPALFRLGSLYEKGQGVGKDSEMARRLYTEAADKGHPKAMHNLAVLYAEGIDGKPDFKTASMWFRKAADHAVADSQYNLGILYARGIGVEQNLAESYKWFTLAAQQGDADAAKKRDEVAARLDPQSLTAAKLAAQTWNADPQPEEAVTVKTPAGGWDGAGAEHKSSARHLPTPPPNP